MLYPIITKTRTLIDLSGQWMFNFEDEKIDPSQKLEKYDMIAVPGAFNEQFTDRKLRLKVGDMVYQKEFSFPEILKDQRVVVRFGSATHSAKVYINGNLVVEHKGGFTPFEAEINEYLKEENLITVIVNNSLDYTTLPVGNLLIVDRNGKKEKKVVENFDFFNFAGLQRPVKIYTTPKEYIKDITIVPDINVSDLTADVRFIVDASGDDVSIRLNIFDEDGNKVASGDGQEQVIKMENIKLWQPLNSYLYQVKVELIKDGKVVDVYKEPFGLRKVKVENGQFLINDKPFYFKGFGKHEDNYLRGRGLDEVSNVKDLNLFKWLNANSFRTSHYPYSDEMMRLADRKGIVVIDEIPAVGLFNNFSASLTNALGNEKDTLNTWEKYDTKNAHGQAIQELIDRDKNYASVVMWSISNESATHEEGADKYFEPLFQYAKELDPQKRPVCAVNIMYAMPDNCLVSKYSDVICLNRYYGWYIDHGDIDQSMIKLEEELKQWVEKYPDKPIMFTEYGADTMTGFHSIYEIPYTEEYQLQLYKKTHEVLDRAKNFVGEQLWNFADFETGASLIRINGNKKGVFTRNREPKMIAYHLKERWKNK